MPLRLFILLLTVLLVPESALAKDGGVPKKLGSFQGWDVYETKQGAHPTCYMTLRPAKQDYKIPAPSKVNAATKSTGTVKDKANDKAKKTETVSAKRSNVYLMITFRPSESMNPVVSYRAGYIFKPASEVLLSTGEKPFNLFTDKDQAWARSSAMDIAITNAIRKAKRITVQGASTDNGKSTDSFNAEGAEKAYKATTKACGIT